MKNKFFPILNLIKKFLVIVKKLNVLNYTVIVLIKEKFVIKNVNAMGVKIFAMGKKGKKPQPNYRQKFNNKISPSSKRKNALQKEM